MCSYLQYFSFSVLIWLIVRLGNILEERKLVSWLILHIGFRGTCLLFTKFESGNNPLPKILPSHTKLYLYSHLIDLIFHSNCWTPARPPSHATTKESKGRETVSADPTHKYIVKQLFTFIQGVFFSYPCQSVAGWAEFRTSVASRLASFFFTGTPLKS